MKVAIVTRFPKNPDAPRGGVESVSVNLTRALAALPDLHIDVVTTDRDIQTAIQSQWEGITVHRLPTKGVTTLTEAIWSGRKIVSDYLMSLSPDLVHAHDTYGLMVKGLPLPRVFTVHGFIYGDTVVAAERFSRLRAWLWKYVETSGWADQPHIISISPYVRERLGGIAKGVIHDIDNPIPDHFYHIKRKEKKGVIFSAASIMPRKNPMALVEAFIRLNAAGVDAELRLAGPVLHASYARAVEERIRQSRLEHKIILMGKLSTADIAEQLAQASVFALVSLEENSPMAIEEAMAVGIPVVTSNRCGMPYMVRHGETGFLVDPHDPSDIATRLEELLRNDDLRHRMAVNGQVIARDRFHADVVARRTVAVYREALRCKNHEVVNNARVAHAGERF